MKLDRTKEQREACYYILAYLVKNPRAGDTLQGIVNWWLLNQRIEFATRTVSDAVAELVDKGLIVEQKGTDSQTIYRVNRTDQTVHNIQTILSQMRSSDD